MITHSHNTSLALAAIVVSIVAAITGLALMNNIRLLPESRRKAVIVMSAFLLGGGIWSMHFLAMLAIQFPVPIHYDLLQTLSSGLIAVLVVGFALLMLHFRERTPIVINVAGLCLGVGIVSMHVVGMLGMRGVHPDFNLAALSVAFVLALIMGVAAVRVSYGSRSRQNIIKGGVLFGLSVVVVHHTAMLGTHFSVDPDYRELAIALNQGALAIVVTVTVFVICGTFLLAAATFGPSANLMATPILPNEDAKADALGNTQQLRDVAESMPQLSITPMGREQTKEIDIDSRRSVLVADGTVSLEIDQADVPASNEERFPERTQGDKHIDKPEPLTSNGILLPIKIPYEQQKQIFFIDSSDVGAIRADGRYTQLYTREGVKFSPWSITEAEKRLAGTRFFRSHRSYLINMLAVASFEKNRDSGVCRFEGFVQLSNVPVSRSRVGELVEELGL